MDLAPDFRELLAEFARDGVEVVIVGGYAVAYHGRPRATKDIDLVLEGSPGNLERALREPLRGAAGGGLGRARPGSDECRLHGQPPVRVDLLRSIDGVESDGLFVRAVAGEIDGAPIRVIALDDLIVNKRAVGRPQDLLDVEYLEDVRARLSKSTCAER